MMRIYVLLTLIIIISCANKGALTGGEADVIPPEISFSDPAVDTTNVGLQPKFYFQFSERVDRNSFESSLFMIPIEKRRLKYNWSGWDEVEVEFVDSIKDFRTYQMIISKGMKDLHGVYSAREYKIAFTRDSELDTGFVRGSVNFRQDAKDVKVALLDDKFQTIYLGDISDDLNYSLNFVKDNSYQMIFFEDKDRNLKIDFSKEMVAIPNRALQMNQTDRLTDQIYFFKTDTTAPVIKSADTLKQGILRFDIEDELDMENSKIYLVDTMDQRRDIHRILKKGKQYYAFFDHRDITFPVILKYDRISDIYGNSRDTIKQTIELDENTSIDTLDLKIRSINLKNNDVFPSLNPEIKVKFNTFIVWNSMWDSQVELFMEKENIPLRITQVTPDEISIKTDLTLLPSKKFTFNFTTNGISNHFGSTLKDSVITYTMYSKSRNKFGTMTFNLISDENRNINYRLFHYDKPFDVVKIGRLKSNQENTIDNIEGGIYKIELYEDRNDNMELDLGSFRPYILSEPIKFITDSIPIRANWDRVLKDITFD